MDLDTELDKLAARLPCAKDVKPKEGIKAAWYWDGDANDGNGEWLIGKQYGVAKGVVDGTDEIVLWPDAHGYDPEKSLEEQPEFLAKSLRTLAHECMHWRCPPHAQLPPGTIPEGPPNPDHPPAEDGRDPDCNDINYAIHTAAELHEEICAAQACLESPGCEGLVGVPGTDTLEGLCKYCQALKDLYGKMQAKWNTEKNVDTAASCACEDPPWDPEDEERPGQDFSQCPDFPSPPGTCPDPYPENKVIPDSTCSCPGCDSN